MSDNNTNQQEPELSLKQLQAQAVELGMPEEDAQKFNSKPQLVATINAIKATKAVASTSPGDRIDPVEEKNVEKKWKSKADKMRSHLLSQSKIRIKIPLEGKETPGDVRWEFDPRTKRDEQRHYGGAVQPVTLNGYQYLVPKGLYVEVPQQVADVIEEKDNATNAAGRDMLIDRVDPKTGKPVRDQL